MLKEKNNNLKVNIIMKQLKNFLIKREQSQACLSFAKREKSRLLAKTILTLVALLAVTTGAWATVYTSKVYMNALQKGDILAEGFSLTSVMGDDKLFLTLGTFRSNTTEYTSNREVNIYGIQSIGKNCVITMKDGETFTPLDKDGHVVNAWEVTKVDDFAWYVAVYLGGITYGDAPSSASTVEVEWNAASKTGSFTMPGGNVELEPEYYPQAALTTAPTAINDVPATTDGAIVNAGTVKNIGETANAQGTVMYYVSTTALDDAALLALDADKWTADVPTAESFTAAGQAYVYYYVRGNDSDTDDEIFSDGDILSVNALTVTIAAAPTYAVTFADGTDLNEWTASPNANVTKDTKVTVTYTGSKKVIGVKAEKKAAKQLYSFTLIGPYTDIRLVVEFYEGDTWEDMVTKYSTTLSIIAGKYVGFSSDGNVYDPTTHKWVGKTDQLVPNRAYYVQ